MCMRGVFPGPQRRPCLLYCAPQGLTQKLSGSVDIASGSGAAACSTGSTCPHSVSLQANVSSHLVRAALAAVAPWPPWFLGEPLLTFSKLGFLGEPWATPPGTLGSSSFVQGRSSGGSGNGLRKRVAALGHRLTPICSGSQLRLHHGLEGSSLQLTVNSPGSL